MNLNEDEIMAVIDDYIAEVSESIVDCNERANEAAHDEDIGEYVKLKKEGAWACKDLMVLESLRQRIQQADYLKEKSNNIKMAKYKGIRKADVVDFFGTVDERYEY